MQTICYLLDKEKKLFQAGFFFFKKIDDHFAYFFINLGQSLTATIEQGHAVTMLFHSIIDVSLTDQRLEGVAERW